MSKAGAQDYLLDTGLFQTISYPITTHALSYEQGFGNITAYRVAGAEVSVTARCLSHTRGLCAVIRGIRQLLL
jgi:hypothetical protein